MLYNPFRYLKKREWLLWLISLVAVTLSGVFTATDAITLTATLVGVTALIFVARGDVWGQALTVVFSLLYSLAAWQFRYYGEIITYLGMSAPIAAASVVTWLRHPFRDAQKSDGNQVEVHRLSRRGIVGLGALTAAVTLVFYVILKALNTENLIPSTVSVATSFAAVSLTLLRSPWYAIAYAANDVVLIVLWTLAASKDLSYLPMVVNFLVFLANDIYGFISWRAMERRQKNAQEKRHPMDSPPAMK